MKLNWHAPEAHTRNVANMTSSTGQPRPLRHPLTHICLVDPSILNNWTSLFLILGVSGVLFIFILFQIDIPVSNQWRPCSDAAFCRFWSGSALFANVSKNGTLGLYELNVMQKQRTIALSITWLLTSNVTWMWSNVTRQDACNNIACQLASSSWRKHWRFLHLFR